MTTSATTGTSSAQTFSAISAATAIPMVITAQGDHDPLEHAAAERPPPERGQREHRAGQPDAGHAARILHERHQSVPRRRPKVLFE